MLMLLLKKYYCEGKGFNGLNDGRRRTRTRRKKPGLRAAAGYARQPKLTFLVHILKAQLQY